MFGREKTGNKSRFEFKICGYLEAVSPEYFVVCFEYLAMEPQTNFILGLEKKYHRLKCVYSSSALERGFLKCSICFLLYYSNCCIMP